MFLSDGILCLSAGKDVKSLRTNIAQSFPQLSEAQVDDLVPAKAAVTLHKLANRVRWLSLSSRGVVQ